MIDLYLVLTPLFAFLSFLTLINLKLTLAEPKHEDLFKYQMESSKKSENPEQNTSNPKEHHDSPYFSTLKHLLKNHTIIECCLVRRSTNKIPFLLSISSLFLSSLFITSKAIYLFSSVGLVITIFCILLKMITSSRENEETKQKDLTKQKKMKVRQKSGQKLEIICTSITLLANLTIIWLLYRNTNNSQIFQKVQNFFIILFVDSILLKPFILSVFAFPLSLWSFSHVFIEKQTQIMQILHGERVVKRQLNYKIKPSNMNKVHNTTSNTQNIIEIQPFVNFDIHGNNITTSNVENKDPSKCSFTYKKSQGKLQQSQSSLIKYISYPFNSIQPNTVGAKLCNLRKIQIDEKVINESVLSKKQPVQTNSITRRRNKLYSERVGSIPEFNYDVQKYSKNAQNQEEIDPHLQMEGPNQVGYLSAKRSSTSRQNQSAKKHSENRKNRQSLDRNLIYQSNQKNHSVMEEQNLNNSCVSGFNYTVKTDLLKIREDRRGEDLQEIDMNSPERRNNQLKKVEFKASQQRKMSFNPNDDNLKIGIDKIFKKYSLDPNNQSASKAIPYMNNQPNYIQKEEKVQWQDGSNRRKILNRTSQMDLSRKSDVFAKFSNDSRMAKSVKTTKKNKDPIVRENDQNQIPQFVIQDFTY